MLYMHISPTSYLLYFQNIRFTILTRNINRTTIRLNCYFLSTRYSFALFMMVTATAQVSILTNIYIYIIVCIGLLFFQYLISLLFDKFKYIIDNQLL